MRRFAAVAGCVVLFASSVIAQEVRRPMRVLPMRPPPLDAYQKLVQGLAAAIKRDSFIVAQLVHAGAELEDFQKLAAIEKAIDRIEAAQKKASEDPTASPQTMAILNSLYESLKHGREQGTMADTKALQIDIVRKTHFVQLELYMELDTARNEHRAIVELENKLHDMGTDLESSMVDALGVTFDFVRAGGQ
jgi:hypothetical protein